MFDASRDSAWLARFRRNLRRWYQRHARDLPWRRTNDAYRIWISEIMLQQTTVTAVVPYYERFLNRFPNLPTLAAADEQDVLRLWEGLGYYSRARNIHRAAQRVVTEHGGRFPQDPDVLRSLPGIGRYTAGAILSFAFDQPAPIVEANTLRLYCRLLGYDGDPRGTAGQRVLWEFAGGVLPRTRPGEFNQALIELGACVCRPGEPDCSKCPVRSCCDAFATSRQDRIPRPKSRPETTHVTEVSVAVRKGSHVLIRRRSAGERWAGLWDFPRFEVDDPESTHGEGRRPLQQRLAEQVTELTGIDAEIGDCIARIQHSVTRYRIQLLCYEARFLSGRLLGGRDLRWASPAQLRDTPLSVTGRQLAKRLDEATDTR